MDPVRARDWADALLVDAALDVHADDSPFRYRFIAYELPEICIVAGENRVQRLCRDQRHLVGVLEEAWPGPEAGQPVQDKDEALLLGASRALA